MRRAFARIDGASMSSLSEAAGSAQLPRNICSQPTTREAGAFLCSGPSHSSCQRGFQNMPFMGGVPLQSQANAN
jgi:hypothetical protein